MWGVSKSENTFYLRACVLMADEFAVAQQLQDRHAENIETCYRFDGQAEGGPAAGSVLDSQAEGGLIE